jgi:hypothetical protein
MYSKSSLKIHKSQPDEGVRDWPIFFRLYEVLIFGFMGFVGTPNLDEGVV